MYEEPKKGVPLFREQPSVYLVFCPTCACYYTTDCGTHKTEPVSWIKKPAVKK
jgi:hypothetical protein